MLLLYWSLVWSEGDADVQLRHNCDMETMNSSEKNSIPPFMYFSFVRDICFFLHKQEVRFPMYSLRQIVALQQ